LLLLVVSVLCYWLAPRGFSYNLGHRISKPAETIALQTSAATIHEKEAIRLADIKEKVIPVIEKIRPMLQADGGDIELIDVGDDGIVKVKLVGACAGCAMSQYTLKLGVERMLKHEIPEVTQVEAV